MQIAGIDVHKKVLMVVVVDTAAPEEKLFFRIAVRRKAGWGVSDFV